MPKYKDPFAKLCEQARKDFRYDFNEVERLEKWMDAARLFGRAEMQEEIENRDTILKRTEQELKERSAQRT